MKRLIPLLLVLICLSGCDKYYSHAGKKYSDLEVDLMMACWKSGFVSGYRRAIDGMSPSNVNEIITADSLKFVNKFLK